MADILIRGMKMPKKDEILVFDEWHGKVYARSTANTGTRRYEVVSLPEGHGRLGDLDALMPDFVKARWEFFSDGDTFLRLLKNAPTIVPAEGGKADDN